MKKTTWVIILSMITHFAIDATTVSSLMKLEAEGWLIGLSVLLYDALAFATQPLFGLFADRKKVRIYLLCGGLLVAGITAIAIPNAYLVAILSGFANAAVHIGGFHLMYESSSDKIAPLGLFVSTGSLGLGMGTLFPSASLYYAILALGLCVLFFFLPIVKESPEQAPLSQEPFKRVLIFPMILVLVSVFLRGFEGTLASGTYSKTIFQSLFVYIAIFAGKAGGGILADHLGILKTVLCFFLPSMIGLIWFRDVEIIYLISLALFNISMPVCLYLAIRFIRSLPSFAFGMTAAFLLLGTFGAWAIQPYGTARTVLIAVSSVLSVTALLYAFQLTKKGGIL